MGQLDHILKGLCSALSVDTGPSDIVTIDVRAVRGSSGSSPGLKNMAHNKVFENKKHERRHSPESIALMSEIKKCQLNNMFGFRNKGNTRKGENHPAWKGNDVSYAHLHKYIRLYLPKPEKCVVCNIKTPYDVANITGTYTKDFTNWQWQCRRCHMKSDGRMKNLKYQNGT